MLARRFPGGSMRIVPARAPRNLRRLTARILLLDEVDGMEITTEGDPITLAERRTLSFRDRKIVLGSTPVFTETSPVLRAYRQSDQRVFEVPCPECGKFNEILWENIVWDTDKPETARYKCPNCEGEINEVHKSKMVETGRWRATKPEVQNHAGFRMNALISPLHNARWSALIGEFLESKKSPETLQTFVNTILGQGWSGGGEEINIGKLESMAEAFSIDNIPQEVRWLTCGVDIQIDRIELVVIGWDRDNKIFVLDQDSIWGSPHESAVWQFLDTFLTSKWDHPLGGQIGIDAVGIDAGDGNTMSQVLDFTQPRRTKRVFAFKGASGNRPVATKSKAGDGRLLFIVGVDNLKSRIHSLVAGQSSIRFSDTLEGRFYEELGSEKRQVRYKQGRPILEWIRLGNRPAESLDCLVYAMAVRNLIFGDPAKREIELRNSPQKQQSQKAKFKKVRSNWMAR